MRTFLLFALIFGLAFAGLLQKRKGGNKGGDSNKGGNSDKGMDNNDKDNQWDDDKDNQWDDDKDNQWDDDKDNQWDDDKDNQWDDDKDNQWDDDKDNQWDDDKDNQWDDDKDNQWDDDKDNQWDDDKHGNENSTDWDWDWDWEDENSTDWDDEDWEEDDWEEDEEEMKKLGPLIMVKEFYMADQGEDLEIKFVIAGKLPLVARNVSLSGCNNTATNFDLKLNVTINGTIPNDYGFEYRMPYVIYGSATLNNVTCDDKGIFRIAYNKMSSMRGDDNNMMKMMKGRFAVIVKGCRNKDDMDDEKDWDNKDDDRDWDNKDDDKDWDNKDDDKDWDNKDDDKDWDNKDKSDNKDGYMKDF